MQCLQNLLTLQLPSLLMVVSYLVWFTFYFVWHLFRAGALFFCLALATRISRVCALDMLISALAWVTIVGILVNVRIVQNAADTAQVISAQLQPSIDALMFRSIPQNIALVLDQKSLQLLQCFPTRQISSVHRTSTVMSTASDSAYW